MLEDTADAKLNDALAKMEDSEDLSITLDGVMTAEDTTELVRKKTLNTIMQMKNADLINSLTERGISVPRSQKGLLMRKEAIEAMIEWEAQHGQLAEMSKRKTGFARIKIHEQEGVNSSPYVFVCVNGTSYYIPRNEEVVVPENVLNVLKDARPIITRSERMSDGSIRYFESYGSRFAFEVIS